MSKSPYQNNRLFFIRRSLNTIINLLFLVLVGLVIWAVFISARSLFVYVLSFEGYLGDILSVIVSILVFALPFVGTIRRFLISHLNRFKQRVYIHLCTKRSTIFSKGILNYNQNQWSHKPNQSQIIIQAIQILREKRQRIFAIESLAYRGKTTSVMLLLDFIGRNIDTLDLFVSLKNKILYFDAASESDEILDFLNNADLLMDSIVIIDNMQKLTSTKLTELVDKAITDIEFLTGISRGCLVLFLFQVSVKNKSLVNELDKIRTSQINIPFRLDADIQPDDMDSLSPSIMANIDYLYHKVPGEQEIIRKHLIYINNNGSLIELFKEIADIHHIPHDKSSLAVVIVTSLLIASFHGYVQKEELEFAISSFMISKTLLHKNLRFLEKEGFLIDFPLFHSTYLFNEKLANQYKHVLLKNKAAKNIYHISAQTLFHREGQDSEKKWLYLVACTPAFSAELRADYRKSYFYNSLKKYSVSYLLEVIEADLTISPEKINVFAQEVGTLYIHNGQWKKARQILKPTAKSQSEQEQAWLLQLKIIEADHGTDDVENLLMLDTIIDNSIDPFTRCLAQFWKYHIHMEKGSFFLTKLEALRGLIAGHPEWSKHEYYNNLLRKLNSDSARTYFLNGEINYDTFQHIMTLIEPPFIRGKSGDLSYQKLLLTQAHYVHYDIIYQRGIWGYYALGNVNPQYQDLSLELIVDSAINAYEECIRMYKAEGDKKWRTVQIRRDELSLCHVDCNFVEVLNHLEDFSKYADCNNIGVFTGYSDTLRGKTFAVYALSRLACGDDVWYDQYIAKACEHLQSAQASYEKYGNAYGVERAKFLHVLVEMLDKRSKPAWENEPDFEQYFTERIKALLKTFQQKGYHREQDMCTFLLSNIKKYSVLSTMLKFYPVVLQ